MQELELISTRADIDSLYEDIGFGDILMARLSDLPGRVLSTPIGTFSHFLTVIKLPNDDNKYVFHTRNKGIKPKLFPHLEYNVKTLGRRDNYQLVQLKEYLSYLKHRKEYFVHLKTHNNYDYTLDIKDVYNLELWEGYLGKNCSYLTIRYMKINGLTKQETPHYSNRTYYGPLALQSRFIDQDGYTYEGIFQPV